MQIKKSNLKTFSEKKKEVLRSNKSLLYKTTAYAGFTLAEVLVTLAVIGVVASLTIPTLMKTTEKAQIVSSVKKYTSTLNQAVKMYSIDNNCVGDLAACGAFAGNNVQTWDALSPYFKFAKNCGTSTGEGCFAPGITYKYLDGVDRPTIRDDSSYGKGILTDGASISISNLVLTNCSDDRSTSNNTPLVKSCGMFYVDINGHKGPNQYGKDFFAWWITKSGVVIPCGASDDYFYADRTTGEPDCDPDGDSGMTDPGGGLGCAGYVMTKGNANYLD